MEKHDQGLLTSNCDEHCPYFIEKLQTGMSLGEYLNLNVFQDGMCGDNEMDLTTYTEMGSPKLCFTVAGFEGDFPSSMMVDKRKKVSDKPVCENYCRALVIDLDILWPPKD